MQTGMIGAEAIADAVFYMLSFGMTALGAAAMAARRPVHAVLLLIGAFFNAAGLWVMMEAAFLAFLLIIVYVGAVAVLFLFVVMMLDARAGEAIPPRRRGLVLPAMALGAVIIAELAALAFAAPGLMEGGGVLAARAVAPDGMDPVRALGRVLYTDYGLAFQLAGLALLAGMVGAIALVKGFDLDRPSSARRQNVWTQLSRTRAETVELRAVRPGEGA